MMKLLALLLVMLIVAIAPVFCYTSVQLLEDGSAVLVIKPITSLTTLEEAVMFNQASVSRSVVLVESYIQAELKSQSKQYVMLAAASALRQEAKNTYNPGSLEALTTAYKGYGGVAMRLKYPTCTTIIGYKIIADHRQVSGAV